MASRRIWIPFLLAALCLAATWFTGPILTVVLMVVALCLVLDGALKWWERSGGMSDYRQ